MKKFLALLKKDLAYEHRAKETLGAMLALALLFSAVISAGVQISVISPAAVEKLFPAFLWIAFALTSSVAIGRSFEMELQNSAIEGVLLSGVSPAVMFMAKICANFIFIALGQLVITTVLAVLLNVNLVPIAADLASLTVLVCAGYGAVALLFSAIAGTSRLKGILLPIITLPIVFPLLIGAVEVTSEIMENGALDWSSLWVSILIGLDVIYIVLGMNLYEHVIHE